jgi:WD40 repeat protein
MDITNHKEIWSSQILSRDSKGSWVKLQFSGDSTLLAVICPEFIHIMNAATGKDVKRVHHSQGYCCVELSIDMELLVQGTSEEVYRIENTYTEETVSVVRDFDARKIVPSSGFKFIAIQTKSGEISVRDTITNTKVIHIPFFATELKWSCMSDSTLITYHDGLIQVWDITTGKSYKKRPPADLPMRDWHNFCFCFLGSYHFLVHFGRQSVQIWDVAMMRASYS